MAGLVLVFLGFLVTSYLSRDGSQRGAVQPAFQRQAVLGMVGFTASLLGAILALASYWGGAFYTYIGLAALAIAFIAVFVTGLWFISELW